MMVLVLYIMILHCISNTLSYIGVSQQDLWKKLLQESNLADTISKVYHSISSSKIAHVIMNQTLEFSLKIPILMETTMLPTAMEPQLPGV